MLSAMNIPQLKSFQSLNLKDLNFGALSKSYDKKGTGTMRQLKENQKKTNSRLLIT
jgi:hypothetical protein